MTTKNVYEIPTSGAPLRERVSLGGVFYLLELTWCDPAGCWMMNVYDDNQGLILGGLPMITGVDLLEQLGYLSIGGGGVLNVSMVVQSDHDPDLVPDFKTLGSTGHIFYIVPADE
jgi:hypothetical protein